MAIVHSDSDLRTQPAAIFALPVLYLHLDPSTIPTPDALDNAARPTCIDAACTALQALSYFADLPVFSNCVDACWDLWQRAWPWILFFHTYWEYIPGYDPREQAAARLCHCSLVARLRAQTKTHHVSSAQPGLRSIFSRAWTTLLLDEDVTEDPNLLTRSTCLLPALGRDMQIPQNFEEVVDGADGSFDRLASAIIKQISLIVASTQTDTITIGALANVVGLLAIPESEWKEEWISVLLRRGIITPVVAALRALTSRAAARFPQEFTFSTVNEFFRALMVCITTPPGYPWLAEALRAGLLHCLISFAKQGSCYTDFVTFFVGPGNDHVFADVPGGIIPLGLISHAVLTQIKKALNDVQKLADDRRFRESPVFGDWEKLVVLAKTRIAVLDSWEAAGGLSSLACDNMLCGNIEPKTNFKRCAGCQSANYCSVECQLTDWKDGHQAVCDELRCVRRQYPEIASTRERAFMRALMDHDYQHLVYDISRREVLFMRDCPGQDHIVVLDYTKPGGVLFQVDSKDAIVPHAHLDVELPVQWDRLTRSGGRMKMHFMYLLEGLQFKPRVFPLRADSTEFYEGLLTIAKSCPFEPGTPAEKRHDRDSIRALVAKTRGRLTEIH
ncbi:hypothetical protein B0H13DRAFT_1882672 [Mycena leptocephala]|nr:hypothetical protein B0H13DRAFT_1882672 [Mycena leptocephala]